MARLVLTSQDVEVMERAARLETGGISAFTSYFFSPVSGSPRWDLVGTSPDTWDRKEGEFVPWMPLPWTVVTAHEERGEITCIGGFGSGKTLGMGAAATYWCCMVPSFKFMGVAPVGWQSKQMFYGVKDELLHWELRHETQRPIHHLVKKIVERPYPKITWYNNSTMEFMSADEQGQKILTWSGDAACIDEADKLGEVGLCDLEELIMNLGTRLRGQIGGRVRMGKLIVMANSGIDPELWDRFDQAEANPKEYVSFRLTTYDNPYLTKKQLDAFERRIPDPRKRRQYLMAERPLPRGREFTPELLMQAQSEALDEMMDSALQAGAMGYLIEEIPKAGVVLWQMPPGEHEEYILLGDPGQSIPPNRNSGVVVVLKVTGFPGSAESPRPAELAAFWWGPQDYEQAGSYWPFIYQMEKWQREYHPLYAAFDATGVQKGFDELVFVQRGLIMDGLNLQGLKMAMVVALKLVMGKGLLLLPSRIGNIWVQLANWHMPDKKLRQDIAACLFMCGHALNQLFYLDMRPQPEEEEGSWVVADRHLSVRRLRRDRHTRPRREVTMLPSETVRRLLHAPDRPG